MKERGSRDSRETHLPVGCRRLGRNRHGWVGAACVLDPSVVGPEVFFIEISAAAALTSWHERTKACPQ